MPDIVASGKDTVLLVCLEGLAHELPSRVGAPLVATSANVSGTRPALDMADIHDFASRAGDTIDAVIEGPLSPFNRPTTIVDTTVTPPVITRAGSWTRTVCASCCLTSSWPVGRGSEQSRAWRGGNLSARSPVFVPWCVVGQQSRFPE